MRVQKFVRDFSGFRPRFIEAESVFRMHERAFAPRFAIAQPFSPGLSESFHSDFIGCLLNPRGTHGQGHIFLAAFLQMLRQLYPDLPTPPVPIERGRWLVKREQRITDGFLDIVLRNRTLGAHYIIENKVGAREQSEQIARYCDHLEAFSRYNPPTPYRAVFYLTKAGDPSYTHCGRKYYCISYHEHLCNWLDLAIPHIEAAAVREMVCQYRGLIQIF